MSNVASGSQPRTLMRVRMRWKMLTAFAAAFTVVFVFIAIFVVQFSTSTAQSRLESQLLTIAEGGAASVDAAEFVALITTVAPVPDPDNEFGLGYPDSPLYTSQAMQLYWIHRTSGEALPYTYFRDPVSGELYSAAAADYGFDDIGTGFTFKIPMSQASPPEALDYMNRGLDGTVLQPAYTDSFGEWISAYTPIRDEQGAVVGGFGVDFPMTYVEQVKHDAVVRLVPVLAVSYVVLLGLVMLLSSTLTRPLRRLTAAAQQIADGDYDIDTRGMVQTRLPDEMFDLAEAFSVMTEKVAAREQSLTREVQRLKVEIDERKLNVSVQEITDSDAFASIAERAAQMRRRVRGDESASGPTS